jgi:lycopene beta-cyclase
VQPPLYDYILAGAGGAGLSLAWQLTHSPQLRHKRILLLDRDEKRRNDRTWGYWARGAEPFDALASWQFEQAEFHSRQYTALLSLHPYSYRVLEGKHFYEGVRQWLRQFPNVEWRQTDIKGLEDGPEVAQVHTSSGSFAGRWVFNSCFLEQSLKEADRSSLSLKQHFKGWVIETPHPYFDPQRLRLFDFRTPQIDSLRFFYLIPQSPQRALVEYTLFSGSLLPPDAYEQALKVYIREVLQLTDYRIVEEEWGVIPMTTYRFPKKEGARILNIGSAGGASKASTGYTFRRMQQQAIRLVQLLEGGREPLPADGPLRHRLYDAMLLNILDKKGARGEEVFARLFKHNPPSRLLKFLDEETNPLEELQLMQTVDKPLFLGSLLNLATGLRF